jgi:ubiquinone/menaquinone biosynthesis C-methylase UbiE
MTAVVQTRTFEGNAEAIEAWNGVLFDKFLRFRHIVTTGLGICGTEALRRHPPALGSKVLDIGCGFGDSSLEIAALVGAKGEVVGVDAAERFIEAARKDAAAAGTSNTSFRVADVQMGELGGPYDSAFSRFGTMFFLSPVAAFRNIRRALKPGGTLTMTVWRKKDENGWLADAERAVLELVPLPPTTDEPTCGPGPFSMSGPDLVSAQLLAGGFTDVTFERFDTSIRIGDTIDEAIDCAMTIGPAGEVMRLAGDEGKKREAEVIAALKQVMGGYVRPDGVFGPASVWIVTARSSS